MPFIGPSLHDTFSKIDESKVEELITSYRQFNHDHHDELVEEYETVYETVQELKSKAIRLVLLQRKHAKLLRWD